MVETKVVGLPFSIYSGGGGRGKIAGKDTMLL